MPSCTWLVLKVDHLLANSVFSFKIGMKFPEKELLLPMVLVPAIWSVGICTSPKGSS